MPHISPSNGLGGQNTPIVVFYGQTFSGKTTTLVRLIRHLSNYAWGLCDTFHNFYYPGIDIKDNKEFFRDQLNVAINQVKGNEGFFLCNLYEKSGDRLIPFCRFLESPGENLFSVTKNSNFADDIEAGNDPLTRYQYFRHVLDSKHKVVWVFFMDPEFIDGHVNKVNSYVHSIHQIAAIREKSHDSFIFLANREDVIWKKLNKIYLGSAHNQIANVDDYINKTFNDILTHDPFTTRGLFGRSKHYRSLFFQSFEYKGGGMLDHEGNQIAAVCKESDSSYPEALWKAICDAIDNKY